MKALSKAATATIIVVILIIIGVAAYYLYTQPSKPAATTTSPATGSTTSSAATGAQGGVIKIGFFAPLTGPASADGLAARTGAEIAVEIINKNGGVLGKKIQLVVYDDALNPDQAIAVSNKLIEEDGVVAAVSGSYSSTTLAASGVFEKKKTPLVVAYAVNPKITEGKHYVVRVGMLAETEGKTAAYAAVKKLGGKYIAILYIDNPYGQALADAAKKKIEELGGQVVFMDKFQFKTSDFSPWLTKIKQLEDQGKLDVLMIFGYYEHAVAVKQAREMGIKAKIIGAEGFDSPKFIEIAGKAAEGVIIVTDFDRDSDNPLVKQFIKMYKEKRGIEPDMVAASAFDAVMVIAKAIEKAGTLDKAKIMEAIRSLKDYKGVAGEILYFTPNGNAVKTLTLQIVKNGEFHRFAIITEKDLITPSK